MLLEHPPGRGKETVEVVFQYESWLLGYGTATREVVGDFYDALKMVEVDRDFDDYMGIAANLKWIGIGETDTVQVMRSQNKLLLPHDWKQTPKVARVVILVDLLLQFTQ